MRCEGWRVPRPPAHPMVWCLWEPLGTPRSPSCNHLQTTKVRHGALQAAVHAAAMTGGPDAVCALGGGVSECFNQCGNPRNPSNESCRRDWSRSSSLPLPTFRDVRLQSLALCSGQG